MNEPALLKRTWWSTYEDSLRPLQRGQRHRLGARPILLPQSVYPLQTRAFLFAQTGFEVYGFARFESVGALDYRLYGGTIFLDANSLTPPGSPFEVQFNVPYLVGGRL